MPKTTRDLIKRRHDQIQTHLDRSIAYLSELYAQFLEHHPDYSEGYENIIMMLMQAKEFVEKMKSFV